MKRSDLIELQNIVMAELVRRRHLGGYSPDAEGLLILYDAMLKHLGHTIERYNDPPPEIEIQVKRVKAPTKLKTLKKSSK
jgi:hypothetical protein